MAKNTNKKYIKISLKSTLSAQSIVEQEIHVALQNCHHVAIVGTVDSLILTDGKLNTVFDDFFNFLSSTGNKLEFFVDQKTADEMRKTSRQNWLMNRQNVIIHIISNWINWSPGELGMKFDAIIANPPYCSGLHLKILQDLMLLSDNIVCIHPASWLQFPTRQRPAFMNGRIGDFQIIDRKEANEMFEIDGGDIVISTFVNDGESFSGGNVDDRRFCCFKYNSRFATYWKIVKSIYDKIVTKNPIGKYGAQLTTTPTTAFPLRQNYGVNWSDNHVSGGNTNFKTVAVNYATACIPKKNIHTRFLNFNTDAERRNAWESYLTKFARFCIMLDESTKLAPYMNNYTQPWDDKRFYKYFGLNKIEIQLIETVIK